MGWTPGVLTNHNTKQFKEPRLMVVVDTYADRKAMVEASYMNIPVIALTNSDSSLQYVDIAIPCNNKSTHAISMVFWLLARDVMVDLFYYKSAEDQAQNEKANEAKVDAENKEEGNWDQNKDQDDVWA